MNKRQYLHRKDGWLHVRRRRRKRGKSSLNSLVGCADVPRERAAVTEDLSTPAWTGERPLAFVHGVDVRLQMSSPLEAGGAPRAAKLPPAGAASKPRDTRNGRAQRDGPRRTTQHSVPVSRRGTAARWAGELQCPSGSRRWQRESGYRARHRCLTGLRTNDSGVSESQRGCPAVSASGRVQGW